MQTIGEDSGKGEVRPSVNKDAVLEHKIDDEENQELTAITEEVFTES
jgi:hypothetical protein